MANPKTMDDVVAQMSEQMAAYQKILDDNIVQYEALVAKAHTDLAELVTAATPTPVQKPECQWTEANGNKLLVLNAAAAEFFTAIFEQVGVLATELGKATKK